MRHAPGLRLSMIRLFDGCLIAECDGLLDFRLPGFCRGDGKRKWELAGVQTACFGGMVKSRLCRRDASPVCL